MAHEANVTAASRKLPLGKSARQAAAKAGAAMPNGKYPIRTRKELRSAIKLRHHSTESYPKVRAHIMARARALGIKVTPAQVASAATTEEFYGDRTKREQMKRRASSKSIRGRDPSLRWPHLYDILRAKGYDKEKAARISNSRLRLRKKGRLEGLPWKKADNKKELRKLLASSNVVAACHERSCRPPTSGGTGGSAPKAGAELSPLAKVGPVVERIRSAGGTPYVVGGYVRDQILGLGSKDLDIEVHGLDADKVSRTLRQLGKVDEVGKAFGVLKITHGGEDLDISLPRTDSKSGTGHTGFDVSVDPHMGIEAALARRDFTINAIAMDPTTGEIVDPYGGARHLEERRLVAVSEAFSEDPLRVLRGVQFAARFGMTMDEGTAALSRTLDKEIAELPLERVWGEFEKIGAKGQDLNAVATVIEQVGLQGRYGNIRPASPNLQGLEGEHRVAVALAAIGADPVRIGATNSVTQRMNEINAALEFTGSRADSRAFARTLKKSTLADAQRINPDLDFDPDVANGPIAPLISGRDLVGIGMKQSPELGRVLKDVTAAQDRGDITTIEEALELARREGGLVASAIVFACHSKACAPPPVGVGGSRGASLSAKSREMASRKGGHAARNTSHYPVDTIKTTRPGDTHLLAPGSNDRTAVRGHKGIHGDGPERRIPRQGETVDIYRDLGHGKAHKRGFPDDMAFSVRHASSMPGEQSGLVVASTTGVILNNGRPSWAHSAKAGAEIEGKRGVHGFIRGEVQEFVNPDKLSAMVKNNPEWKKVTYYPGSQDFFDPVTRDRFVGSDQVALVNGEFFAKNPQYVPGPTPVSPIERKIMEKMGVTASAGWYE